MNLEESLKEYISHAINQSIINRENRWIILPKDQQESLNKILDAIHDIKSNTDKIKPEYRPQVSDAMIIKLATELGLLNGGNRQ